MGDWQLGRASPARPVHWVGTELGGACSCAAIGVIFAFSAVLVVQFWGPENTLDKMYMLPARASTLEESADYAFFVLAPPLALLPTLTSGLQVRIAVVGATCRSPTSETEEGFTASSTTSTDSVSVHTYACPQCTFNALSALRVEFPGACQSFALIIAAVGAQGAVTAASYVAAPPPNAFLTSLSVTITPSVDVLLDKTLKPVIKNQGLFFTASSLTNTSAAAQPESVTLEIRLPAGATISGEERSYKFENVRRVDAHWTAGAGAPAHTPRALGHPQLPLPPSLSGGPRVPTPRDNSLWLVFHDSLSRLH